MNSIEKTFSLVQTFSSDIFVADYTLQTQSQKGVTIQGIPFDDIQYFELHNSHGLPIIAVNFENNKGFPDHSDRAPFVSFRATQNDQVRWLKRNRIHLLGYNDLLVVNEGQLMVPLVKV